MPSLMYVTPPMSSKNENSIPKLHQYFYFFIGTCNITFLTQWDAAQSSKLTVLPVSLCPSGIYPQANADFFLLYK